MAALIVGCIVIGQLMPEKSGPLSDTATAETAPASTTAVAHVVTAGDEVTRDDALAVTDDTQARKSPQLVAMKYALAYTDIEATTGEWITALSTYAAPGAVAGDIVAHRPVVPVAISGPTSSNTAGELVIVPTSSGQLTVNLTSTPTGWQVATPLPQLDDLAAPTTSSVDEEDTETTPVPTTTTPPVTTATTPATTPTPALPAPVPAQTLPRAFDPTPVPGPIPAPSLQGPLPGRR